MGIGGQPCRKGQKRWVQLPGGGYVPGAIDDWLEVPVELEHIAQVFGAGETQTPEGFR